MPLWRLQTRQARSFRNGGRDQHAHAQRQDHHTEPRGPGRVHSSTAINGRSNMGLRGASRSASGTTLSMQRASVQARGRRKSTRQWRRKHAAHGPSSSTQAAGGHGCVMCRARRHFTSERVNWRRQVKVVPTFTQKLSNDTRPGHTGWGSPAPLAGRRSGPGGGGPNPPIRVGPTTNPICVCVYVRAPLVDQRWRFSLWRCAR